LLAIASGLGDALPNNQLGHETHSSGVGDTAPYRSVVVNDLVQDAQGQKMSKRLGNIVDPSTVIPRHGADAVRLFLMTSSQIWMPRRFDEAGIRDTAGRFLLTFKNVYTGIFAEYANFGWAPSDKDPAPADRPLLDRWILSRLATVEREADESPAAPGAASRVDQQGSEARSWEPESTRACRQRCIRSKELQPGDRLLAEAHGKDAARFRVGPGAFAKNQGSEVAGGYSG